MQVGLAGVLGTPSGSGYRLAGGTQQGLPDQSQAAPSGLLHANKQTGHWTPSRDSLTEAGPRLVAGCMQVDKQELELGVCLACGLLPAGGRPARPHAAVARREVACERRSRRRRVCIFVPRRHRARHACRARPGGASQPASFTHAGLQARASPHSEYHKGVHRSGRALPECAGRSLRPADTHRRSQQETRAGRLGRTVQRG